MPRKSEPAAAAAAEADYLALPFEHLVIVVMSLARGQWYVKVLDKRTGFHATAGGNGAPPHELVHAAWQRLCSANLTGDLYEPF